MKMIKINKLSIAAAFILASCYKESPVDENAVITTFTAPTAIPADGKSVGEVLIELPENAARDRRNILLTTTKGVFAENEKKEILVKAEYAPSGRLFAAANLRSTNEIDTSKITASVGGVVKNKVTYFSQANPDRVLLQSDKIAINPGFDSEVTVIIQLQRNFGQPTLNSIVTISLTDKNGNELSNSNRFGYLRNADVTSDENGKCSFIFSVGNSGYLGEIGITVRAGQNVASDKLVIYSVPK